MERIRIKADSFDCVARLEFRTRAADLREVSVDAALQGANHFTCGRGMFACGSGGRG